MTSIEPNTNKGLISNPKINILKTVETTIAMLVANPFTIFSAW